MVRSTHQIFTGAIICAVAILYLALRQALSRPALIPVTQRNLMSTMPNSSNIPNVKLQLRPSEERGNADHGWLHTFHTFAFSSYANAQYPGFGPLRVINEDRVDPNQGFGTHGHREMEIYSYIVDGELEHKDSMGNVEILKRGDVQLTSAGTGITHSEFNRNKSKTVHFLQMWSYPSVSRLTPRYFTRHFTDDEKRDKLTLVVAPIGSASEKRDGSGPAPVQTPLSLYASILSASASVSHTFAKPGPDQKLRKGYFHLVQNSGYNTGKATGARVKLNGDLELSEGDGAFVWADEAGKLQIENIGSKDAEFILFDIE